MSAAGDRILIVDDEEPIRRALERLLERSGYSCTLAADPAEARARLAEGPFELVLADVNMPGESGIDFIRDVIAKAPGTAVAMVTGLDDPKLARIALEIGAYGYIIKPATNNEILIGVANALRRRKLEAESRNSRESLEQEVRDRTAELRRSREETIRRLSRAVEFRNEETGGHIERMSRCCGLLAARAGLEEGRAELVSVASPMHDVGKIAIADSILLKPGPLTPEERTIMQEHTQIGHRILAGSGAELLDVAATIALTHHEKWDGSGYPRGLAGEEIPLEGRLAAVGDVFDALTSERPYRPAFSREQALEIMREGRGSHFDPRLLDLFLSSLAEATSIQGR